MNLRLLLLLFLAILLLTRCYSLDDNTKAIKNITVIGTVFCDVCSNNTFTKNSYFLQGVKVLVECKLRSNSIPSEEISITVNRVTDQFGVYKLEIPPVAGFECKDGREPDSLCQANLVESPSPLCNLPSIKSSTEHVALKHKEADACIYNLNALSYRPSEKDNTICGTNKEKSDSSLSSSLFFWPPFPPCGFPWPGWKPFPFPFPFPTWPFLSPPSLPFPFPPIPFFTPPPPSFPFPLPPLWPTPDPPPHLPFPFPPLPPVPSLFPSPPPPPPSLPFPLPPFTPLPPFPVLPPFTPIPSLFQPPPPPPPSPPPPSFPFPFPPFPPLFPTPGTPTPPPPTFSLRDPRSWFPSHPPSSPNQPGTQQP